MKNALTQPKPKTCIVRIIFLDFSSTIVKAKSGGKKKLADFL